MTIGIILNQKMLHIQTISHKNSYLFSIGADKKSFYISMPGNGCFNDIDIIYPTYEIYINIHEFFNILTYMKDKGYIDGLLPERAKANHKWFYAASYEINISQDEMLEYIKSSLNVRVQYQACTVWI